MKNTRYRRGKHYAAEMALYSNQIAQDNSQQIGQLRRNLLTALREDITPRQREVLLLYYSHGYTMEEIGAKLGVHKSTVSRTIQRGERRLQRCLRYGAERYLRSMAI